MITNYHSQKNTTKLEMWKNYGSLQLKSIRSTFQKVPELKRIPLYVIKRSGPLKLHKKNAKEEDMEVLGESGCLARV